MINLLINKNNELLKKYQSGEKREKQLIIAKFLKSKDCFFKVRIEEAYNILKDLEFDNYEEIYLNLISYDSYINL